MTIENPFFPASTLPYELPPFAAIREEHYTPAFDAGFAEHLAEIKAIAENPEPATFENTIVAMERAGALLRRVAAVFFAQTSSDTTDGIQDIEQDVIPRLAAHSDAITLDAALFARIDDLYERRADLGLSEVEVRLLEKHHLNFVLGGAKLSAADKDRLKELNEQLAALSTDFDRNLLAANKAGQQVFDSAEQLAGLSADAVAAAKENGEAVGLPGKYVISLKNFSNQTQLAFLDDREARHALLTASLERAWDTNGPIAVQIAKLRAERAALLGYSSYAEYAVQDRTAQSTEAVEDLMSRLIPAAVANAAKEAKALRAHLPAGQSLEAWDWTYYSEKVRLAEYDVDSEALRPYLELDRVLINGVFHAAELVYGITFKARPDLVAYHPDVRIWEVFNTDGSGIGLFLGDFYARGSKRGGAWMTNYVDQSGLLGQAPVVVNNLNLAKPPAGEPTLLTWDEVRTLFHEFGHALHGLFSDVEHPTFSGTNTPRDFVEYPSQVNEMWAEWPEVLANYAKHYRTGEPVPAELLERMAEAEKFGQGFATVEILGAVMLDWAWHKLAAGEDPGDAKEFEAAALTHYGLLVPEIPSRYRTSYFAHIWGNDYSAGYYSYLWSEVLDKDTVDWFKDGAAQGRTIRESGEAFRRAVLSRGGSVDLMAAFAQFRGRAPEVGPMLRARGLEG
ncbi:Peptidyl-dipeptidase Dcp [Catenulispora acidiphila DSM 44928]|uniref:Dipeptidyl carboxypeptidase n=1 Tax=Catenulispora acidiphila (strain DSM 44928 / JCM 14897 / NBRC 102108 / NRRL B-24433 / ID139908) TaxID=479433 RepID=C7QAS7_CATAD|nr:M3 family metallopeptidase [Catenulispora acidiphila]ACU74400.1 Peptidyl-dipeptidase Dcp [Catenulispora acidiphila DSM 44928]